MGPLTRRITYGPDRRQTDVTPLRERREPFVAPWRKRQIEQAGGDRFRAMADTTERAA